MTVDEIKERLREQVRSNVLQGWYTLPPAGNYPRQWCLNPTAVPCPPLMRTEEVLLWLDGIES